MIFNKKFKIWGKVLTIKVEYDCYEEENEKVTKEQKKAFKNFLKHPEWIEKAKKIVEDYCYDALKEDTKNNEKNNIFTYIKIRGLWIKRDNINPRIALMCDCPYELEHGLAIVFDHDGNITVGIQDIIL